MSGTPEYLGNWLTKRLRKWLRAAESQFALNRCGGWQRCPWCRRIMQLSAGTSCFDDAAFETQFTCGHCGGSSFWRWEIGFIYLCEGHPPTNLPERNEEGMVFMETGNAPALSGEASEGMEEE